jgi:predicted RNA-binding Zn-ribbon protein involved in translation (DUF1610 family)
MANCHACGAGLSVQKPQRSDLCPGCGAAAHACLNCRHYDRHARHECREPQAEWVRDKDKANFCDWFEMKPDGGKESAPGKNAFDALFRK